VAQRCANLNVPAAITRGLWQLLGGGDEFELADKRLRDLCYSLLFARAGLAPGQRFYLGGARALVFQCSFTGRDVMVQCVAHPGEQGQLVATFMREDEDWRRFV